ncbi:MAG: hypothetical protein KDD50_04515 [Bdellovibrionales bacterium]|nr:hypothetical protein [Bdellovibrionales bacterium]
MNYIFLILTSFLLVSYQACSKISPSDTQIEIEKTSYQSGNGGVYGGLQKPLIPRTVQPGQTVEIQIVGGSPPYNLWLKNNIGSIKKTGISTALWTLPESLDKNLTEEVHVSDASQSHQYQEVSIINIPPPKEYSLGSNLGHKVAFYKDYLILTSPGSWYNWSAHGSVHVYSFANDSISKLHSYDLPLNCHQRCGYDLKINNNKLYVTGTYTEDVQNEVLKYSLVMIYEIQSNGELKYESELRSPTWGRLNIGSKVEVNNEYIIFGASGLYEMDVYNGHPSYQFYSRIKLQGSKFYLKEREFIELIGKQIKVRSPFLSPNEATQYFSFSDSIKDFSCSFSLAAGIFSKPQSTENENIIAQYFDFKTSSNPRYILSPDSRFNYSRIKVIDRQIVLLSDIDKKIFIFSVNDNSLLNSEFSLDISAQFSYVTDFFFSENKLIVVDTLSDKVVMYYLKKQ